MTEQLVETHELVEPLSEDERALDIEKLGVEAVDDVVVFDENAQAAAGNVMQLPTDKSDKDASKEVDVEAQKQIVLDKLSTMFGDDPVQMALFKKRLEEVSVMRSNAEDIPGYERSAYYLEHEIGLSESSFASPAAFMHDSVHELFHAAADDDEAPDLLRHHWLTESITEELTLSVVSPGESGDVYPEQRAMTQLLLGGVDGKQTDTLRPLAVKAYMARGFNENMFNGALRDAWGVSGVLNRFEKVLTKEKKERVFILKNGTHSAESEIMTQIVEKYKHDPQGLLTEMRKMELA